MATRAEKFRYEQERSKPKRPPQPKKPRLNAGTKKPRGFANGTMHEHTGLKGDQQATVVLEENHSGRPSRKTTRKSAHGHRGGEQHERARISQAGQASSRHGRRGG
ncbi:MAG: hypothetical protein H6Q89_2678 [Myxococcaceae bacterium]|nr:hypothetical protein [Myxococcaceae bacterium]